MAIIFAALLIVSFTGCKTTPEADTETDTVVTEQPAKDAETKPEPAEPAEPAEPKADPLSKKDIETARKAVQQANNAGANTYFPKEYRSLVSRLNKGIAKGKTDPDQARKDLAKVKTDADALYKKSMNFWKEKYAETFSRNDEALKKIEAHLFAEREYQKTQSLHAEALALTGKGNFSAGKSKADETLETQRRLYHNLKENIRYVDILKRDTENYIQDAEDNEAFTFSPEELKMAETAYQQGISAYQNYDMQTSVRSLTEAKRQAILAARTSAVRKKQSETDSLMTATQRRIESASELQILTEEGEVVAAQPWNGNEFLANNPLIDHAKFVDFVEIEDTKLKELTAPVNAQSGVSEDIPIDDETTQVKADTQESDYLLMAKDFWQRGVYARNNGDFDLAQDYFKKAQAYTEAYESNAVSRTYTVVRRKVATDCLWRISDRTDIYADAYLWPKIWRANRKIIQNPDLIYPGQILVIPPK